MARSVGSVVYAAKLSRFQTRVERPPKQVVSPPVRTARVVPTDPQHLSAKRARMKLLRQRVEFWTGLLPEEWQALPARVRRTILTAIREYYEEIAEPRSPHGGMYGLIADTYGGLPWVDWTHDGRGVIDDGY